jgi:hypothetical protein
MVLSRSDKKVARLSNQPRPQKCRKRYAGSVVCVTLGCHPVGWLRILAKKTLGGVRDLHSILHRNGERLVPSFEPGRNLAWSQDENRGKPRTYGN